MKNKEKLLVITMLILIILLTVIILIQKSSIDNLESLNYTLKKNISKEKPKDNITINLDISSDTIFRIGIYSTKHYEITDNENMQKVLDILNTLSFKKVAESSNISPFYTISFYTIFDKEIFSLSILSSDTIKVENTLYKCNNGKIDIEKIAELLK